MLPQSTNLSGFYRGVVEDNNDPKKAGRVRVRIFGLHTEKLIKTETEGIPVDELPWAEPCFPIYEGSVSGYGMWSIPLQGSHVMLFFENGNPTRPIYFASMPGIPESKLSLLKSENSLNENIIREVSIDSSKSKYDGGSKFDGFKDPDGVYPKSNRLGEPDVDRLARGQKSGTYVQEKNANLDTGVSKAGGGTWDEPQSAYNAKYPENIVFNTHGGVVIELDSTPGSKRFSVWHPSNSYVEVDNDGVLVIRNESDSYEIVVKGKNIHIKQDKCETIDGDENLLVGGDRTEEVDGNVSQEIGGNKEEEIIGNKEETIGGSLNITVTGNVTITSPLTTVTGGLVKLAAQGTLKKLMNELMIALYNSHQHNYTDTGAGAGVQPTTPPINNTLSLAQATENTEAS